MADHGRKDWSASFAEEVAEIAYVAPAVAALLR